MHVQGRSVKDIAAALGVTDTAIYKYLSEAAIRLQTTTSFRDDQLSSLYESGLGIPQIAERMGVSEYRVRAGLQRRGQIKKKPDSGAEARRGGARMMYQNGAPISAIADAFGVTPRTVRVGYLRLDPKTPDPEAQHVRALYDKGLDGRRISQRLGMHVDVVRLLLRRSFGDDE